VYKDPDEDAGGARERRNRLLEKLFKFSGCCIAIESSICGQTNRGQPIHLSMDIETSVRGKDSNHVCSVT